MKPCPSCGGYHRPRCPSVYRVYSVNDLIAKTISSVPELDTSPEIVEGSPHDYPCGYWEDHIGPHMNHEVMITWN